MIGYTVRFSVSTIEELLDNGTFDMPSRKGDLIQAKNELDVHYRYGNISTNQYEALKRRLNAKLSEHKKF